LKRIKMHNTNDGKLPVFGYALYGVDYQSNKLLYCRWWAYPAFALKKQLRTLKWSLFRWLNQIGVMHTPKGCEMRLTDLWRNKLCK
jgi:hypothetical protein